MAIPSKADGCRSDAVLKVFVKGPTTDGSAAPAPAGIEARQGRTPDIQCRDRTAYGARRKAPSVPTNLGLFDAQKMRKR